MSSAYLDSDVRRASVSVAASQTDAEVLSAEAGRKLRVLAAYALASGATALTFGSKPSGGSTAIGPAWTAGNGLPVELPYCVNGWFETFAGEGLCATTGSGQTTGIVVVAVSLNAPASLLTSENNVILDLEDGTPLLLESA